jgi:hypothetical protein
MQRTIYLLVALVLVLDVASASAQELRRSGTRGLYDHRVEIIPYGGYVWTTARTFTIDNERGDLDIKSGGFWGIAVDFTVQSNTQLQLNYNRQDSELTFTRRSETIDLAVEYFHLGLSAGIPRGNYVPFANFSLGATRLNPKASKLEDAWKFSMIIGFGTKIYLGQRFGLRFLGRVPYTFTSGGGELFCDPDTGKCYRAIGGMGIPQVDLSAGLIIMF